MYSACLRHCPSDGVVTYTSSWKVVQPIFASLGVVVCEVVCVVVGDVVVVDVGVVVAVVVVGVVVVSVVVGVVVAQLKEPCPNCPIASLVRATSDAHTSVAIEITPVMEQLREPETPPSCA